MADRATTIVIKGKVGYEDEITPAQAAQIIAFLNAEEGDAPTLGALLLGDAGKPRGSGKRIESAREALDVSGAKTNPEKIVALGAYVLQDGGDTFKAEDVKAQFRRARETAPGNFPRDLSTAVAAGWLAEDKTGEFYVTNKIQGIFAGNFKFPKSGNGTRTRSTSRRGAATAQGAKAKSAGKPEAFAHIDVFPSTMDGFQPYSKMKLNKDKFLWVLKLAKDLGVAGLTNKQIDWLTDHLGAGVPNKQITSTFNTLKAPGHANRSTQDGTIRITESGETHLATIGTTSSTA